MLVPYVVAGSLGIAGLAIAIQLGTAPEPFARPSALVIAVGVVMFTVIAISGLLINRGKWSRVLSIVVCGGVLVLAGLASVTLWSLVAIVGALGALLGLSGRWLTGWLRPRPSATGPGTRVVFLVLGTLGLVPAVGIASPAGLETGHGILGAAGVLLAWGYSKANVWALWGLRLVLPLAAIPAIVTSPPAGAVFLAVYVAALTVLAWTADARIAVTPTYDRLPGPRYGIADPSEETSA